MQQAVEAKQQKVNEFLAKRNVVGMGVGFKNRLGEAEGEESVVVLVQTKKPVDALQEEDLIPPEIDGVKTDVVEIGVMRAQQSINPRQRLRPVIQPGVSMAHFRVGAGTLGAVVRHRQTGEVFLLSNNHVFANSNDAQIGEVILQPGALDGGNRTSDAVARLAEFRALAYIEDAVQEPETPTQPEPTPPTPPPTQPTAPESSGCDVVEATVAIANALATLSGSSKKVTSQSVNAQSAQTTSHSTMGATPAELPMIAQASLDNLVDAALARPDNAAMFSNEVLQIGRINGTKAPTLGMTVAKMGRTTGYTEGRVNLLNATINVQYDTMRGTRTARFVEQVITSGMSESGDSGSLVVDPADNFAIGLLFAGSGVATLFTPIDRVLSVFNVGL